MNQIVENLVKRLKSKPPTAWTPRELQQFGFDIETLYTYGDKEDRDVLRPIYNTIFKFSKTPNMVNPGALIYIDNNTR